MNEDAIDSFTLDLHDWLQANPAVVTDEGYEDFAEYVMAEFEARWSRLMRERNYN